MWWPREQMPIPLFKGVTRKVSHWTLERGKPPVYGGRGGRAIPIACTPAVVARQQWRSWWGAWTTCACTISETSASLYRYSTRVEKYIYIKRWREKNGKWERKRKKEEKGLIELKGKMGAKGAKGDASRGGGWGGEIGQSRLKGKNSIFGMMGRGTVVSERDL